MENFAFENWKSLEFIVSDIRARALISNIHIPPLIKVFTTKKRSHRNRRWFFLELPFKRLVERGEPPVISRETIFQSVDIFCDTIFI